MNDIIEYNSSLNLLQDKALVEQLNEYNSKFNSEPPPQEIKLNKFANNSKYLPISFLEMKLDTMLLGLWQTKNFQYQTIGNEIVGSIEIHFFHPIAKQWLSRVGAGAVQIQFKKDTDFTLLANKIQNTLTKDFPHLKAECFRNACLSLGKSFGRDLNREHKAEFSEFHNDKITKLQQQQLHEVVKARQIPIGIVKQILESYGFLTSADITNELYELIKSELREWTK